MSQLMRRALAGEFDHMPERPDFGPARPLPKVVLSAEARAYLASMDAQHTEPGMVLSLSWATGRWATDDNGNVVSNDGPGLVIGWHKAETLPPHWVVDAGGFSIGYQFPPTDGQDVHIRIGAKDAGEPILTFDGSCPFRDPRTE